MPPSRATVDVTRRSFARTQEVLFPLLEPLSHDEEPLLRQHLAEQLEGLAAVCMRHQQPAAAAAAP